MKLTVASERKVPIHSATEGDHANRLQDHKALTTCCHERRSGFVCCAECFFLKKKMKCRYIFDGVCDSFVSAFQFLKDEDEKQILSVLL